MDFRGAIGIMCLPKTDSFQPGGVVPAQGLAEAEND